MFYNPEFAVLHLAALALSLVLLGLALRLPLAGRIAYAALFAWACSVNWYTVLVKPLVYLDYGPLAVSSLYAQIISGFFAAHIVLVVGAIATCQGLIAAGLLLGGRLGRIAAFGALLFLIAIAPLGVGSGFPSTLIMAVGLIALMRGRALDRTVLSHMRAENGPAAPKRAVQPGSELAAITTFLALGRVALIGASSREDDFSRMVMRALLAHGMDVVPVNPKASSLEGKQAYARVDDIVPGVDGALLMVPAEQSAEQVAACAAAGIRTVWLHRGVGKGAVSDEALALAHRLGLTVIPGRCPLMFLPEQTAAVHKAHATIDRLLGRAPASQT